MTFRNGQRDVMQFIFQRYRQFHANQLVDDIRQDGCLRVSKATIYRTLKKMVEAGLLRRIDDRPDYFEHDVGH